MRPRPCSGFLNTCTMQRCTEIMVTAENCGFLERRGHSVLLFGNGLSPAFGLAGTEYRHIVVVFTPLQGARWCQLCQLRRWGENMDLRREKSFHTDCRHAQDLQPCLGDGLKLRKTDYAIKFATNANIHSSTNNIGNGVQFDGKGVAIINESMTSSRYNHQTHLHSCANRQD